MQFDGVKPAIVDGEVMMPIEAFAQMGFENLDVRQADIGVRHIHFAGLPVDLGNDEGRTVVAKLEIDFISINLFEGVDVAQINHYAGISAANKMLIHGVFLYDGEMADYSQVVVYFKGVSLNTPPRVEAACGTMMLPIRPIAEAAGFSVKWDGQTIALTRSETPWVAQGGTNATLFEIAYNAENLFSGTCGIRFSLYWGAELRQLEMRTRDEHAVQSLQSDDISVVFNAETSTSPLLIHK